MDMAERYGADLRRRLRSAERLSGVLIDHGVEAVVRVNSWAEAAALPKGAHGLAVLPLEHGFETDNLAVISETDILGDDSLGPLVITAVTDRTGICQ